MLMLFERNRQNLLRRAKAAPLEKGGAAIYAVMQDVPTLLPRKASAEGRGESENARNAATKDVLTMPRTKEYVLSTGQNEELPSDVAMQDVPTKPSRPRKASV
mmetsp:Transcript_31485/g.65881  ORF Transcript_31485/g.65881 Transcript_31485/m.65881 type:complete len:103 (+) Transcript_31485:888-1196(+)